MTPAEALTLLDGIAFRGRIETEEKLLAWRAIKLLWREGVGDDNCRGMVEGISSLSAKHAFGPTLAYYINSARWALFHAGKGPNPHAQRADRSNEDDDRERSGVLWRP